MLKSTSIPLTVNIAGFKDSDIHCTFIEEPSSITENTRIEIRGMSESETAIISNQSFSSDWSNIYDLVSYNRKFQVFPYQPLPI